MDNFPSVPGDPNDYPNHDLDVKTDVVSMMYDENLLHLAQECISTSQQAIETLQICPKPTKEVMEEEGIAWLRNYLMQLAKRTAQHAAGCLDFFELRPPRDETTPVAEQLDRLLLEISPTFQRVYRGFLYMLSQESKYVPPIGPMKKSRAHVMACAVVDTAICNPGVPIQLPIFDQGKMNIKNEVSDVVSVVCKTEPEYRNWFRLVKTAVVRPWADSDFPEYHIYALTFQEPVQVQED